MVVPTWDPSGGRDRRFASSWLAWAIGDPASKQQNILAFRYSAAMEPAVCTYLEVISFHLTKQPLLVTIMSHSGYWSQGFPFSTWLVRVGPGASPAGSHHFLCSFFNSSHGSSFLKGQLYKMSLTLVLSCSQVLASMQFGPESGEVKPAISLSASEVTSSHFRFKYLSTSTLPPGFLCVVIPHPRHLTSL